MMQVIMQKAKKKKKKALANSECVDEAATYIRKAIEIGDDLCYDIKTYLHSD